MTIDILQPGPQATLQAAPRVGQRHLAIPASGPADRLSCMLANCLVGNRVDAPAIEITAGPFQMRATESITIAITGAANDIKVNAHAIDSASVTALKPDDVLTIAPPRLGMRTYLAVRGGLVAEPWLGSASTYLPARVGGLNGRALRRTDQLRRAEYVVNEPAPAPLPRDLRFRWHDQWVLRVLIGRDLPGEHSDTARALFDTTWRVHPDSSRMGIRCTGSSLPGFKSAQLPSRPVFPGTIQWPGEDALLMLLSDAQTTGGYAQLAAVTLCDQHLLGQCRPGDTIRLHPLSIEAANATLKDKQALFAPWLGAAKWW
ncbi:MAG: biotin-dependent carboxyltransferase family protein [Pseudomonadota bacterium]